MHANAPKGQAGERMAPGRTECGRVPAPESVAEASGAGVPLIRAHLEEILDEDVQSGSGGFDGWSRWLARFKKDRD